MAVPAVTIVDRGVSASSAGSTGSSTHFHAWKSNPSLPENALVFGFQCNTTVTAPTLSDDQGNTWSAGPTLIDAGNGQQLFTFYKLGAAPGTRHLDVNMGAAGQFCSAFLFEVAGLATSGAHTAPAGSVGTSPRSAGSFSPANVGDCIIQMVIDTGSWPANGITGFTKGSGFAKLTANRLDGMFSQWRTAPGGAINPTVTIGGSGDTFLTLAMSLPADLSKGTLPPAGATRIKGVHHFAIATTFAGTTLTLDVPSEGNGLLVSSIMARAAGPSRLTGITDTRSNAHLQAGSALTEGVGGYTQQFHANNAKTDDELALTITLDNAQTDGSTIVIYDVANLGAFDTFADATGNQTSAGDLATVPIAPSQANGLVVSVCSIDSHTVSGANSPFLFNVYSMEGMDGGGSQLDQDNGWCSAYPTDTSTLTPTYTIQHNTAGVQLWAAKAMAFLAPAAAPMLTGDNGPGFVVGSPWSYIGEMAIGAPEFVPGFSAENGPGLVIGSPNSLIGEAMVGAPEFVPGASTGPGLVSGSATGFIGEGAVGAPDASGGITVVLGQAVETDTAQPIGRLKVKVILQTLETDLAQAVTSRKTQAIAQTNETDTAQAVTWSPKNRLVNRASEIDTAQAIAWAPKNRLVARADETDLAQPIIAPAGHTVAVAQANESDTAQALTSHKTRAIGLSQETDLAQAIAHLKRLGLNLALEIDTSQAVAWMHRRLLAQASENDAAQPITFTGGTPPTQVRESGFIHNVGRLMSR